MKSWVRDYFQILAGLRRRAAVTVAVLALAGMAEGLALAALVPVLEGTVGQGSDVGIAARLYRAGFDRTGVVALGLAAFAALGLVSAGVNLIGDRQLLRIRATVEVNLRIKMTDALLRMRWSDFVALRLGDISKSMLLEGQNAALGTQNFLRATSTGLVAIAFIALALLLSARLTIITIAFGGVAILAYRTAGRRAHRHSTDLSAVSERIGDRVGDVFGNLKYFRATGRTDAAEREVSRLYLDHADALFKAHVVNVHTRFGYEAAGILLVAAFVALTLLVLDAPVATSFVFLAVFYRLAPRIMIINDNLYHARIQQAWITSWSSRYRVALAAADVHRGKSVVGLRERLTFKDVTFSYDGRTPVLHDIDLSISNGECIAVVGRSGSGKTTLLDLVTGLLQPTEGSVEVDGTPLDQVDLEQWRARVGIVMQDNPIFHTTVFGNVAWADPHPDPQAVRTALERSHSAEFIDRFPDGVDTVVGEKGSRLSGGQRQRLALARALYRDPVLLLLDEPTSALDSTSEGAVISALEDLKGDMTIVIVTHRLTTVEMADRIVVLDEGRIVETGTFSELSSMPGRFRAMVFESGAGPATSRTD